jgi:hypothetical protein
MDELAGFDHGFDHQDFAGHDDQETGVGDSAGLGTSLLDDQPHDTADALPTDNHEPADHPASSEHHTPTHHAPEHHVPAHHEQPHPVAGGEMEMSIYGEHYDAGRIDVDMNGDGHSDTSVLHTVRDGVGQVEYYTDNNGDGQADELTITDDQGHLISHTEFDPHTDSWVETPLDHRLPTDLPDR